MAPRRSRRRGCGRPPSLRSRARAARDRRRCGRGGAWLGRDRADGLGSRGRGCTRRRSCRRLSRGPRRGIERRLGRDADRHDLACVRRQQRERVDIPLRVARHTHAEMDVRLRHLWVAARPDRPDRITLFDDGALGDRDRPEVHERHREATCGLDRDGLATARNRPGKGNGAPGRRPHDRSGRSRHVDAAVLAGEVRIATEDERTQHRPAGGPGPRTRRSHTYETRHDGHAQESPHAPAPCCLFCQQIDSS